MIIQMTEDISGPRYDNRMWPRVGTDFEVPDEEGQALVAQGLAVDATPPPPKPAKGNGGSRPPAPSLRDLLEGQQGDDPPAAAG